MRKSSYLFINIDLHFVFFALVFHLDLIYIWLVQLCFVTKVKYEILLNVYLYLLIYLYEIILISINTFISISMRQIAVGTPTNAGRL